MGNTILPFNYHQAKEPDYTPGEVEKTDDKIVISMGLNATALEKQIAKVVEDRLVNEFTKNARDIIMKDKYYNARTRYSDTTKSDLKDWIIDIFKEFMRDNREEIIQAAAKELAKSMQKSKPVRERFCDVLEEELNA